MNLKKKVLVEHFQSSNDVYADVFRVDPCKMIHKTHEDMKQIHENPKLSELERTQQSIEFFIQAIL